MAIAQRDLSALVRKIDAQSKAIAAVKQQIYDSEKRLTAAIDSVKVEVASVKADLQNLDSRVQRQRLRLSAVENSSSPLPQRSRTYGTEVQSVARSPHRRNCHANLPSL